MTDLDPTRNHDRAGSAAPIVAIARSEVRTRWLGLVLIALLAGVVGAVAIGGVALARRTTTAYDRLGEATQVDDARGHVLRYPELVDDLTALPVVRDSWVGGIGIAKLDGDNSFLGITAGPRVPSPIIDPIVLDGRLPEASPDADVIEIVLRDDFQREFDVPLGSTFPVQFLTEADYFRFDSLVRKGGDVHGPRAVLEVVGTVRLAGGFSTVPPAFASGAALESHPEAFVGTSFFIRLVDGSADVPELEAGIESVVGDRTLPPEGEEFSVIDVSDTSIAEASVENTASLLGGALMLFAVSTAVVGGVAVTQALARHHTATARAREVEQALGLTRAQQTGARLLAGLLPAVLATALAAIGATAAAGVAPIGAIDLYEPHPGSALNLTVVVVGLVVVFAGVLAATALTSALQGRQRSDAAVRESSMVNRVSRLGGTPSTVLGLRFALEAGRGSRAVPVRSAIVGATVGVAGVVAGLVFVSSLDRLIASPARSAIPFDVGVADVTKEDLEGSILANPLVGDVSVVETAPLRVDRLTIDGHAIDDLRGSLDIGLEEGRFPRTPDEITLGLRAAQDLGVGAGDTVTSRQPGGEARELAVVGVAVVPTFNGEELGLNAVLTREGLEANALAAPFSGAAVKVAPGQDVGELTGFLASRFEADAQPVPVAVQNLEQLGGLPAGVAAIVGSIAVLALANALVVAVRRRRRDLAVLRSMGFTRQQTAVSVVVMSLAIVAIGVVVGLPIGLAVGATLWRITASGAFVLSDTYFRWELLALPVLGSAVIALVAALVPARQAAGQSPATGLQAE